MFPIIGEPRLPTVCISAAYACTQLQCKSIPSLGEYFRRNTLHELFVTNRITVDRCRDGVSEASDI